MKSTTLIAAASIAATAIAAPVGNISANFNPTTEDGLIAGVNDFLILNFALTLEHIETAFYIEALSKFPASDFESEDMYENVLRLARDEAVHVQAITSTLNSLGQDAVKPCNYSFPYTTAAEFLALASIIEGVGVSAYAGAASSIVNPAVLTAAASILPIEARHDALLRLETGVPPYASPFDTPLDLNQVYTLASQFIVPNSCPTTNPALPLTAFPTLSQVKPANSSSTPLAAGATIVLKADVISTSKRDAADDADVNATAQLNGQPIYAAFLTSNGAIIMPTMQQDGSFTAEVPAGVAGQVYVLLVTDPAAVHDSNTVAGPAVIEVADVLDVNAIMGGNGTAAGTMTTTGTSAGMNTSNGGGNAATGTGGDSTASGNGDNSDNGENNATSLSANLDANLSGC